MTVIFLMILNLSGCFEEETPDRDQIPLIKEQIYKLELTVKNREAGAIDSLLDPGILKYKQSSDSLLAFVYGVENDFPFHRFGNCEIFYTNDRAISWCFIMDSTQNKNRPVKFTWVRKNKLWLLRLFEAKAND